MSDELFEDFKSAVNLLSERLEIDADKIKWSRQEEERTMNLWYSSSGKGEKYSFEFYMDYEKRLFLDINYSDSASSFHLNTHMWPQQRGMQSFVRRAIHNFNLEHNPVNLEKLFTDPIIVGGIPRISRPSNFLIDFILKGSLQYPKIKVKIYRFTHMRSDDYTNFSYMFWIGGEYYGRFGSDLWFFFPEAGGPSSGGASLDYEFIEDAIKEVRKIKKDTKVIDFDIEYENLEAFILRRQFGLNDIHNTVVNQFNLPNIYDAYFGKEIESAYNSFKDKYYARRYPEALGDLRAIIQDALELLCQETNTSIIKKEPDISDLKGYLKKSNIIDDKLLNMISTFTSYANRQGSHTRRDLTVDNYPTDNRLKSAYDIENKKRQIVITFILGSQILLEVQQILCPSEATT